MTVLIHNPHNPKIVETTAGEQVTMELQPSESSEFVPFVQLHLWLPDLTQNTVPPIVKTQPRSADNENAPAVHPRGGTK